MRLRITAALALALLVRRERLGAAAAGSGSEAPSDAADGFFASQASEGGGVDAEDAADAATQRRAAKKRPGPRWPCSAHQKKFVESCRDRFDANPAMLTEAGSGWLSWMVLPKDAATSARLGAYLPKPHSYQLHPWGVWAPEHTFKAVCRAPPCPVCGCKVPCSTAAAKWRRWGPSPVIGGPSSIFYIDSKVYTCDETEECRPYYSTDPDSVRRLPDAARLQFRILLNKRSAVDFEIATEIFSMWREPVPTNRVARYAPCCYRCACVCSVPLICLHPCAFAASSTHVYITNTRMRWPHTGLHATLWILKKCSVGI